MEEENIEMRKKKEHVMVDVDEIKMTSQHGDTHRESQGAVVVEYIEEGTVAVKEEEKKEEEEKRREKVERMRVCITIGDSQRCWAIINSCVTDDERRELLNHRENDFKGSTFHLAIKAGDLPLCKLVVNACRDDFERRMLLNAIMECNDTALHYAAWKGHLEVVKWLLSDDEGGGRRLGFDSRMPKTKSQSTALHYAVMQGHLSCCKALIDGCRNDDERREMLNSVIHSGRTVLHWAASGRRLAFIQWLLSDDDGGGRRLGFDSLMARNKDQETALHVAAQNNHLQACQVLLDACRDSRERIALIQAVDKNGRTILHRASHFLSVHVIKWILQSPEMQFIYNLKENDGFTALHDAILYKSDRTTPLANAVNALLFDTEAESQAAIIDDNDNQKDWKRIATKIDPNIGCGLDWNP